MSYIWLRQVRLKIIHRSLYRFNILIFTTIHTEVWKTLFIQRWKLNVGSVSEDAEKKASVVIPNADMQHGDT